MAGNPSMIQRSIATEEALLDPLQRAAFGYFPGAVNPVNGLIADTSREKRRDYFENSRRATEVQREYARRYPHEFAAYDENCWGLTARDGPTNQMPGLAHERRRLLGYAARGLYWKRIAARRIPRRLAERLPSPTDYDDAAGW